MWPRAFIVRFVNATWALGWPHDRWLWLRGIIPKTVSLLMTKNVGISRFCHVLKILSVSMSVKVILHGIFLKWAVPKKIIHINRIYRMFHCKPSCYWDHPFMETPILEKCLTHVHFIWILVCPAGQFGCGLRLIDHPWCSWFFFLIAITIVITCNNHHKLGNMF